eukprot:2948670-Prymnesium_polylepis.1
MEVTTDPARCSGRSTFASWLDIAPSQRACEPSAFQLPASIQATRSVPFVSALLWCILHATSLGEAQSRLLRRRPLQQFFAPPGSHLQELAVSHWPHEGAQHTEPRMEKNGMPTRHCDAKGTTPAAVLIVAARCEEGAVLGGRSTLGDVTAAVCAPAATCPHCAV